MNSSLEPCDFEGGYRLRGGSGDGSTSSSGGRPGVMRSRGGGQGRGSANDFDSLLQQARAGLSSKKQVWLLTQFHYVFSFLQRRMCEKSLFYHNKQFIFTNLQWFGQMTPWFFFIFGKWPLKFWEVIGPKNCLVLG